MIHILIISLGLWLLAFLPGAIVGSVLTKKFKDRPLWAGTVSKLCSLSFLFS
ncbi:hypothetical protein J4526_06000 [Desulfurococcaceae archaeon MEX13E-LK6-19]|nr:hypothetical protein J4526_06000 [Desulfurococcaceae archaeon MEX13E-LK6-19]